MALFPKHLFLWKIYLNKVYVCLYESIRNQHSQSLKWYKWVHKYSSYHALKILTLYSIFEARNKFVNLMCLNLSIVTYKNMCTYNKVLVLS